MITEKNMTYAKITYGNSTKINMDFDIVGTFVIKNERGRIVILLMIGIDWVATFH